jgi:thioredoxin-dependent peroxiredoxin
MKPIRTIIKVLLVACAATLPAAGADSHGGGTMLMPGEEAPDFSLQSDKGDTVRLADYRGKNYVVLVFYPGDETPGCTHQLCAIRDDYSKFREKGAVVFGINPAGRESHRKFVEKQQYQFPLLVDAGKKVASLYGANGMMIQRTVYIVDKEGKIAYAKRGMPPDSEILDAIAKG